MLGRLRGLMARKARQPERMICGLGNPGPCYANTRHNAGYQVADRIASARGIKGAAWTTHRGLARLCTVEIEGTPVALVQPLTFMNLSGQAVRPLLRRFRLASGDLLVVCDDLDLPLGAIRLRPGGSAGGHKGVQSIIDHLGTQEFARLRIGIGRPGQPGTRNGCGARRVEAPCAQRWAQTLDCGRPGRDTRHPDEEDVVSYVLKPVPRELRPQMDDALDRAAAAAQAWVSLGLEAAMNRFNQR